MFTTLLKYGASSLILITLIVTAPQATNAQQALTPGSLFKGTSYSSVYYYSQDGKRYVFPNEKTYKSWYANFDSVITVDDSVLASIPIGGNVRYRPGSRLLKITTDPKVYAVSADGVLRWVTTEAVALSLYGSNWNQQVDDLPDPFFVDYAIGNAITAAAEFNPQEESNAVTEIDMNQGAETVPNPPTTTSPTTPTNPQLPMTGISPQTLPQNVVIPEDFTGPIIGNISVAVLGQNSAKITWTTNEPARNIIKYSPSPLSENNYVLTKTLNEYVTTHTMTLTYLGAQTLYYFTIQSIDLSGNVSSSVENSFETAPYSITSEGSLPIDDPLL